MRFTKRAGAGTALLMLFLFPALRSEAALTFSLNSPITAANGLETLLSGRIQSDSVEEIYLNNIAIVLDGDAQTYFIGDSGVFFANVPGFLNGDFPTYTGPIAGFVPIEGTPKGSYTGSITLLGGGEPFVSQERLATATFQINTTPAPEPCVLALMGVAAPFVTGVLLRRRRRL